MPPPTPLHCTKAKNFYFRKIVLLYDILPESQCDGNSNILKYFNQIDLEHFLWYSWHICRRSEFQSNFPADCHTKVCKLEVLGFGSCWQHRIIGISNDSLQIKVNGYDAITPIDYYNYIVAVDIRHLPKLNEFWMMKIHENQILRFLNGLVKRLATRYIILKFLNFTLLLDLRQHFFLNMFLWLTYQKNYIFKSNRVLRIFVQAKRVQLMSTKVQKVIRWWWSNGSAKDCRPSKSCLSLVIILDIG